MPSRQKAPPGHARFLADPAGQSKPGPHVPPCGDPSTGAAAADPFRHQWPASHAPASPSFPRPYVYVPGGVVTHAAALAKPVPLAHVPSGQGNARAAPVPAGQ